MLNDLLTLKKIKEGDMKTFELVFRQYYSPLSLYAFSITGSKDAAEEIVQELFYVLWKDREKIQILHSVKNYLYGATRNQSLQHCEHRNVRERYRDIIVNKENEAQEETPLQQLEYKELEQLIDNTLKHLPERRLKIFQMHRVEGRKYKEIAETLSLSVKTVEAEMTKTYQSLRLEIEKYTHVL